MEQVLIYLLEWFWDFRAKMEWTGFGTGTDFRSGYGFWFLVFTMEWNGMELGPENDGFPRNHGFPDGFQMVFHLVSVPFKTRMIQCIMP